jgi:dihydropyrimidine dehydrogenase (NAD+) subunit PreA
MRYYLGKEPFIIGSGGVSDLDSAVQQIMVGADAVWVCTETMVRGFAWLPKVLEDLASYMEEMGYRRIADIRDLLLANIKSAGELVTRDGFAQVDLAKCSNCGNCWDLGHCSAISHPGDITTIDAEKCLACSTCADVCSRGAITMVERT